MRASLRLLFKTTACFILLISSSSSQEPAKLQLRFADQGQTVFAEAKVLFHCDVRDTDGEAATLSWRLMTRGRSIGRGRQTLKLEGGVGVQAIEMVMPPLNEEIAFDVKLLAFLEDADGVPVTETQIQPLWLFSPNIFADRQTWLKELNIVLFDPQKNTLDVLEKQEIPVQSVRSVDALAEVESGLLIIGEGTSFSTSGPLAETIWQLADGGLNALVLPPAEGQVVAADIDNPHEKLQAVNLRRHDRITEFDKRLDSRFWNTTEISGGGLVVDSAEGSFSLIAADRMQGWPFVDFQFAGSGGRVMVCTFPIVEHWRKSPTPRYLLLRILEELQQ